MSDQEQTTPIVASQEQVMAEVNEYIEQQIQEAIPAEQLNTYLAYDKIFRILEDWLTMYWELPEPGDNNNPENFFLASQEVGDIIGKEMEKYSTLISEIRTKAIEKLNSQQ